MQKQKYKCKLKKKALKALKPLPLYIRQKLLLLMEGLREHGPLRHEWPNFSKLASGKYHCHLTRSYVACWQHDKGTILIEVYYVGSRENAPY